MYPIFNGPITATLYEQTRNGEPFTLWNGPSTATMTSTTGSTPKSAGYARDVVASNGIDTTPSLAGGVYFNPESGSGVVEPWNMTFQCSLVDVVDGRLTSRLWTQGTDFGNGRLGGVVDISPATVANDAEWSSDYLYASKSGDIVDFYSHQLLGHMWGEMYVVPVTATEYSNIRSVSAVSTNDNLNTFYDVLNWDEETVLNKTITLRVGGRVSGIDYYKTSTLQFNFNFLPGIY